jgi:hypothetical protein
LNNSSSSAPAWLILWLLVAALGSGWFAPGPQAIKGYTQICEASTCRASLETSYRVMVESQTVVASFSGVVQRLENCVVYDVLNWRCQSDIETVSMDDGEYSVLNPDGTPMVSPIGKWRYRALWLKTLW